VIRTAVIEYASEPLRRADSQWWTALGRMERPEFEKQADRLVGPGGILVALRDYAAQSHWRPFPIIDQ
jgi:hypothetical protein